uniref:TPX2_importin domain-containing protein n=1 Tax=Macrostomum lignano TaxID=282301 RepID=A0A1I8FLM1_9PLAT
YHHSNAASSSQPPPTAANCNKLQPNFILGSSAAIMTPARATSLHQPAPSGPESSAARLVEIKIRRKNQNAIVVPRPRKQFLKPGTMRTRQRRYGPPHGLGSDTHPNRGLRGAPHAPAGKLIPGRNPNCGRPPASAVDWAEPSERKSTRTSLSKEHLRELFSSAIGISPESVERVKKNPRATTPSCTSKDRADAIAAMEKLDDTEIDGSRVEVTPGQAGGQGRICSKQKLPQAAAAAAARRRSAVEAAAIGSADYAAAGCWSRAVPSAPAAG